MSGLFLSYSRADRALADQIIRGLRAVGVAVWWDEDMRGVDWQMELEHRISELAGVMVIWTPHSINSNPVRDEARLGLETDKLVNVLCGVPKPPFPYDRINGLPLDGWVGREAHRGWSRLVETVEELVVQSGGARAGDITVAQAMREEEVRRKQAVIDSAAEIAERVGSREAEASENAAAAAAALTRAEEQLQRVAGWGVTPLILKAAQQEFESARATKLEADQARKSARAAFDDANLSLSLAKSDLEALFSAVIAPPVLPARRGPPPTPKTRPVVRADPTPPVTAAQPAPAARPRKARAVRPGAEADAPRPEASTPPDQPQPSAPAAAIPRGRTQSLWSNPTARWVAIAGTIGVAAVIAVTFLGRHGTGPPAPGLAVATNSGSAAVAPQAAAVAVESASAVAGNWALPGTDCSDAATLAIDGDILSFTMSGSEPTKASIEPGSPPGVVKTRSGDGEITYSLHGDKLWMAMADGTVTKMSKCAG